MKRFKTLLALVLALGMAGVAQAADPVRVKFVLDWKFQGLHAWFLYAQDKGYFAREGLDVSIDQGDGSAGTVTKIAAGAYDAGFGDFNAIIQVAATRPQDAPVAVYMLYNRPPFVIVTRKDRGIRSPRDLEGKTIGAPANAIAGRLFPVIAKNTGVDASKVKWNNMAANLQETLLIKGDVDAIAAFVNTTWFSVKNLKVDPEKDLSFIFYADHGVELYSNCVMVSRGFAQKNPEAVRGLVRAINRAFQEVVANPDAGMDVMMKREPLLDRTIERERLVATANWLILTPEAREIGLGDIKTDRYNRALEQVAAAFELSRKPAEPEVFSRAFLPPLTERRIR